MSHLSIQRDGAASALRASLRQSVVRIAAASAAVLCVSAGSAFAADIDFTAPVSTPSDFALGANWAGGVVPGSGDSAFIAGNRIATIGASYTGTVSTLLTGATNNGSGELRLSGGSLTAGGLQIGRDTGALGLIAITGGTLTSSGNAVLGEASTGDNRINISAGTLNLNGESYLGANGNGSMYVSGSAIVNTKRVNVANATNSTGLWSITGGTVDAQGEVFVGLRGTGTLTQTGGSFKAFRLQVGQENEPSAKGVVNVSGGTMTIRDPIVLGEVSPNDNQLNVSGGTVSTAEIYNGANGRGTVNVSGTGTLNVTGQMHIGAGGSSNGALNVTGGNLNMTGPGGWILVGQNGVGTFSFSAGAIDTKIISVGQDPTSTGTAVQTGGTLRAQYSFIVSETSTALSTYSASAGTIEIGTDGLDPDSFGMWVGSYSGKGTFNITGTSAVSNRNGITIGYGQGSGATGIVNVAGGSLNTINPGIDGRVRIGVYAGTTGTLNVSSGSATFAGPILNGVAFGGVGVGGTGLVNVTGGSLTAQALTNETGSSFTQTGGTASLGEVTGGGSMTLSGGTTTVTRVQQSAVSVAGTGTLKIANATTPAASVVNTLTLAATGKVDLTNNGLVVDYTGTSPMASVRAALAAGQIVATLTPADARQSVAYAEASTLGITSFLGTPVDASAVVLQSRLRGDTDLNGTVAFADLLKLAQNYNVLGTADWTSGDFNYDGSVTFSDLLALAQNYNAALSLDADALAGIGSADFQSDFRLALSMVPEPTSLLALASAGVIGLRRRRD